MCVGDRRCVLLTLRVDQCHRQNRYDYLRVVEYKEPITTDEGCQFQIVYDVSKPRSISRCLHVC